MTNTRYLTLLGIFVAIELMVGLIPNLGFIPIPGMPLTIMHIPVIIAAIILGAKAGAIMGFMFGLVSFINATFIYPSLVTSVFFTPFFDTGLVEPSLWSLVICFVPRIAIGLVVAWVFALLSRVRIPEVVSLAIIGILGSLTNTVLVLGGIFLFFPEAYAVAAEIDVSSILFYMLSVVYINGLLEAALAGFLTVLVAKALLVYNRRG